MGGEGPTQLFQQNKALYALILGALHYNQSVLDQNALVPFDRMWERDDEYNKRMDKLIETLGAGYQFVGPNGEKFPFFGQPPPAGSKLWHCASGFVAKETMPDQTCVPLTSAQ